MAVSAPSFASLPATPGVTAIPSGAFPKRQTASDRGKNLPPRGAKKPPSADSTREASVSVNQWFELQQHSIRLVIAPESGENPIIHMVDVATGDVIRQISAEEVLELADRWKEHGHLSGDKPISLVVDDRA